jgi:hypothetical protein
MRQTDDVNPVFSTHFNEVCVKRAERMLFRTNDGEHVTVTSCIALVHSCPPVRLLAAMCLFIC